MSERFFLNGVESQFLNVPNFEDDATLCVSKISDLKAVNIEKILSEGEFTKFNSFGSEKRKIHFFLGRYSAKFALFFQKNRRTASEDDFFNFKNINIENGVFGQPVLQDEIFDVSISHSGIFGAAVVFNKKFPMGLDLQEKNETQRRCLLRQITEKNINIESLEAITAIWSLKEALSKILKCGLTIPQNFLELQELFEENNKFYCKFQNFSHYQGIARFIDNVALAIVAPIYMK